MYISSNLEFIFQLKHLGSKLKGDEKAKQNGSNEKKTTGKKDKDDSKEMLTTS